MSHYDSECRFCGDYGMFKDSDCSCLKSREYRQNKKLEHDKNVSNAKIFLRSLNCPERCIFNDTSTLELEKWIKNLLGVKK